MVPAIFISAMVALAATFRLINPQHLTHLWVLAAAGIIGFIGNEIAARARLRGGRRLDSPALIADGNHARADGYVSPSVVASAFFVALGLPIADPIIGPGRPPVDGLFPVRRRAAVRVNGVRVGRALTRRRSRPLALCRGGRAWRRSCRYGSSRLPR